MVDGSAYATSPFMTAMRFGILIAVAACGAETTSFRTTDKSDGQERGGASAAAYEVRTGEELAAQVHVWSNGGYIGSSDEPMTHFGFEIRNPGTRSVAFDGEALSLVVYDKAGVALPDAKFTAVTPLGPALVPIPPGTTTMLEAYFTIPVRPRFVDTMRVRWALRVGTEPYVQQTHFTRDDDFPVLERK